MKAIVTIENGITTIVLRPENDFEVDVIEKAVDHKNGITASCHYDNVHGQITNHSVYLRLNTENR